MAERSRPSRAGSFSTVVGAGLAGAAVGLVAAGRDWATASTEAPGPREVAATGADVAPVMLPLALVALASWGAFLVLRTNGRRVVSGLGAVAAAGGAVAALVTAPDAGAVAVELLSDPEAASTATTAWPWVAAGALALSAGAFCVAAVRCPRWPQMSRRYDRAGAGAPADAATGDQPADLWRALDDGRDPTL